VSSKGTANKWQSSQKDSNLHTLFITRAS
jgi:hypothetical protein